MEIIVFPVVIQIPAAQEDVPREMNEADPAETDAAMSAVGRSRRENADLPDRISPILHRWMTLRFPEEMTEDVRLADVNRIHENTPEPLQRSRGSFMPGLIGHYFFPVFVV